MAPCARAALMRSIEGKKGETLQSVITLSTIRDAITYAFQGKPSPAYSLPELDREKATSFQLRRLQNGAHCQAYTRHIP